MGSFKGWLDYGFICYFRLKEKEFWVFGEGSYGKAIRKSMVDKGCLIRFVM